MYNREFEKQIDDVFTDLEGKVDKIISEEKRASGATERIIRVVSGKISAEAEGYIIDMYDSLVKEIEKDEFFTNPNNLNAFYRLNLRNEIIEKYQFNIEDIDTYKNGIEYKEINKLYISLGAATGTLALEGILKSTLFRTVRLPFVVVIAGAVVVALSAYYAYHKLSTINRKAYREAVKKFLADLKNDILNWYVDIEVYCREKIRELYKQEG